jgi:hypothetical protein
MNSTLNLEAEIREQLEDDILYFGWLRQLAESEMESASPNQRQDAVLDISVRLVDASVAVLGSAERQKDLVVIQPWSERGHALRERIQKCIVSASTADRDFCFWVQLKKHYEAK